MASTRCARRWIRPPSRTRRCRVGLAACAQRSAPAAPRSCTPMAIRPGSWGAYPPVLPAAGRLDLPRRRARHRQAAALYRTRSADVAPRPPHRRLGRDCEDSAGAGGADRELRRPARRLVDRWRPRPRGIRRPVESRERTGLVLRIGAAAAGSRWTLYGDGPMRAELEAATPPTPHSWAGSCRWHPIGPR